MKKMNKTAPPAHVDELSILGINVHDLLMKEAVKAILRLLEGGQPSQVCFVNADCVNIAYGDTEYRKILQSVPLVLADGIGLKVAGRLLGQDIRANVNGTDLFPVLCAALSGTGQGVYLLGASPGMTQRVSQWIRKNHPGVTVSGCHHGYFSAEEEKAVIQGIKDSGAAVLLVAMGVPSQDKWIHTHLRATGVKVALGVGGLFDFFSARIPRAPLWMRRLGLEWVYRLLREPRRLWRRYLLGNAVFLARVFRLHLFLNASHRLFKKERARELPCP